MGLTGHPCLDVNAFEWGAVAIAVKRDGDGLDSGGGERIEQDGLIGSSNFLESEPVFALFLVESKFRQWRARVPCLNTQESTPAYLPPPSCTVRPPTSSTISARSGRLKRSTADPHGGVYDLLAAVNNNSLGPSHPVAVSYRLRACSISAHAASAFTLSRLFNICTIGPADVRMNFM